MPKNLKQLPKLKESFSFLYLEHCKVEQDSNSLSKLDKDGGKTQIPIANITCLMLGPGTSITHAAIKTATDCGCSIVWSGEDGMKFYAYGMGETRSAKNILMQASACMNEKTHLRIVEKMYYMRFGSSMKTQNLTLNQLRGIEGVRMKNAYKSCSNEFGIPMQSRDLGLNKNWNELSPLDQALIIANKILYALCSGVIVSMGFSTALGFIHTGRAESFSYDIADLYKTETTIPAAFSAVKLLDTENVPLQSLVRRECRKYFYEVQLMKRMPKDIISLFNIDDDEIFEPNSQLWDGDKKVIETGSWNLSQLLEENNGSNSS